MKIQENLEDILQRIILNREEALEDALASRRKQEVLGSECNTLKNQQIALLKAKYAKTLTDDSRYEEGPVVCSEIHQSKKDRFKLIVLDRDPDCLRIIKVCDPKEDFFLVKKTDVVSLGLLTSKSAQRYVKNLTKEVRQSLTDWGINDFKLRVNSSYLGLDKSLLQAICDEDRSGSKMGLYQEIIALLSTDAVEVPAQPSKLIIFSNLKLSLSCRRLFHLNHAIWDFLRTHLIWANLTVCCWMLFTEGLY